MSEFIPTIPKSAGRYLAKAADAYVVLNQFGNDGPNVTTIGGREGWAVYIGKVDFSRKLGRIIACGPEIGGVQGYNDSGR